MLKICGPWVAHVIMESAQGPNPFFSFFGGLLFNLGAYWDQDLDQGLTTSDFQATLDTQNIFSETCINAKG